MGTTYSITFNGVLEASLGTITPGQCVCLDSSGNFYIVSTLPNRAGQRTKGVVTFLSFGGKAVQIQSDGICDKSITQIPFLAGAYDTPVRVNAGGSLERANPVLPDDEIVGSCDQWGNAILVFGQPSSSLIGDLDGDCAGPPTDNVVEKINGTSVNTAGGGLPIGAVLTTNSVASCDWALPASPTLEGDVTGTADANTVVAIQGVPVTAGAPTTGYVLTATSPTAAAWEPNTSGSVTLAGDAVGPSGSNSVHAVRGVIVTASAPSAGQVLTATGASAADWETPGVVTSVTMAGDVTGPSSASVVEKAHGATVPIAGALTTGNGLYVTGTAALTYSALNLAGGSNYVTGVLPVGNTSSLVGDSIGALDVNRLVAITGTSLAHEVTMDPAANFVWPGGALSDSSGALSWTGSGYLSANASNAHAFYGAVSSTYAGVWLGAAAASPSTANYAIMGDGSTQLLLQASSDLRLVSAASVNVYSPRLAFDSAETTALITQADKSVGAASPLTIRAQGKTAANSTGADLILEGGTTTGTAKLSGARFGFFGGVTMVQANDISTAGNGRVLALCVGAPLSGQVPSGGGDLVAFLADAATVPTANPSNGELFYSESGSPKYRDSTGFVVTL